MLPFFKKRCLAGALILSCALQSCQLITGQEQEPKTTVYTIKKGTHDALRAFAADPDFVKVLSTERVRFSVIFDSTAVYATKDPANQRDMNKLYGLSDCSSDHHTNSVRFGWRWYGERLEVHAYTYRNKVRESAFIGYVTLGKPSACEIRLEDQAYVLTMDGKSVSLPRNCNGKGEGYQLYPYFGGDEAAPHDITISIQELL
ncbi:hypothetical protein DXT99_23260 [Pontibacter diazotrophicus]|uniref:Lipoprotein n=1 Tax=Pontibacter diazotrophicus TaxID=1400979 RepID=A0A3D8L3E7_9BACT|nr:hypothetical protein [Pontibacter diazotrophicus]RDV11944.1 hypothetical protein DXT99_23260 [Pontibacter diazotrophicus]